MLITYLGVNLSALGVLLLVGSCIAATSDQASDYQGFDCSGTYAKSSLTDYEQHCFFDDNVQYSLMNRLDYVKTCFCNLIDKTLVWDSMLTHDIEAMYYAVRQTILDEKTSESEELSKSSMLNDEDFADQQALIWDKFSGIVAERPPDKDGTSLSRKFEEHLSRVYYDPETLKRIYVNDPESDEMLIMIAESCKLVFKNFSPFQEYFDNLVKIGQNSRLVYRVVKHYPTLFKLLLVNKICNYMSDAQELYE